MNKNLPYSYRTIREPGTAELMERGSRFLAFVRSLRTETEAKDWIQQIKLEHKGAAHVCFAWVFEDPKLHFRYYDDGEPGGSAGIPIYHALLRNELSYAVVAVVRYFGGKKLGIPGLIEAYGRAAEQAILDSGTQICVTKHHVSVSFTPEYSWEVYNLPRKIKGELIEIDEVKGAAFLSFDGQEMPDTEELSRLFPTFEWHYEGCY